MPGDQFGVQEVLIMFQMVKERQIESPRQNNAQRYVLMVYCGEMFGDVFFV